MEHKTVLLKEAVDALVVDPSGLYVDGTFGRGGHSQAILDVLGANGKLLAIDKDSEAVSVANHQLGSDKRFSIEQGSFAQLSEFLKKRDWHGKLNGLLLDLGVSSPQLDQADRGFSFRQAGPLDMRMDNQQVISAETWVNETNEAQMIDVFKRYGEERFSKRIARAIIERRQHKPFKTTDDLADVVAKAHPAWEKNKHPATRVFQAIRIAVNSELDDLTSVLDQSIDMLAVGGRLVVISFHSLEDRIVKQFVKFHQKGAELPIGLPITDVQLNRRLKSIGKAIKPSDKEVLENVRARSAIMRVAEKVA